MNDIQEKNQSGVELFNEFFKRLKTHYPSWRQQLKSQEEHDMFKQELIKSLVDNGINSKEKLGIGLDSASRHASSWLPSAGEFVLMCTPSAESLGLPDVRTAYREAVFHQSGDSWSCSLVYFSQIAITYELRTLPESRSFKIFSQAYNAVLEQIIQGVELAPPPKALPKPEDVRTKTDPKKVSDIIKQINKDMGWQ